MNTLRIATNIALLNPNMALLQFMHCILKFQIRIYLDTYENRHISKNDRVANRAEHAHNLLMSILEFVGDWKSINNITPVVKGEFVG